MLTPFTAVRIDRFVNEVGEDPVFNSSGTVGFGDINAVLSNFVFVCP